MANHTCDVAVLGAGPGGYVAAIRAAQLGLDTILIEKGELGGVCLNVGCIPSKALINAGNMIDNARKASVFGVEFTDLNVDMKKLVEWKNGVVKKLTGGIGQLLKMNGARVIQGTGTFTGATRLEVKTPDGGIEVVTAKDVIISTGSRPIEIPGFEVDGKVVLSSTETLDLEKAPKSVCVIGGGYIGLELGTYLSKMGSQ
ncbi:MAG: FAD-dependent oxidoreductase, partial [Planctomycetota bacterium]